MTGDLLAYVRVTPEERLLVALNLGEDPYNLSLSALGGEGRTLLSTYLDQDDDTRVATIALRANEGVVVALSDGLASPK
jgi:hypothetical protein